MKYYFPAKDQSYTYFQTNRSDDLGSTWSSFNLDLQSNLGTMRVAPRLKLNTSSATETNMGCPVAFKFFESGIYAVAGTRVFRNTGGLPQDTFTEDTTTGARTDYSSDYSDLAIYDGFLWGTTGDELLNNNGTYWISRDTLSSSSAHFMTYFQKFDRLYFTDSNTEVRSITTNNGVSLGDSTTQFDITNPAGTTFRYTFDGTGTNPNISSSTVPTGTVIDIDAQNFNSANNVTAFVTNSGTNFFEITNASGVVESNKTIGSGSITLDSYSPTVIGEDYTLNLSAIDHIGGLGNDMQTITCIASNSQYIWVGVLGRSPGRSLKGRIYQWDGISAQVTAEYKLEAQGCLALLIKDDIPYAMDSNGALLKYTGTSFDEIGRLPTNNILLKNCQAATADRFIHPNGLLETRNNTILALVNNENMDNGGTINENFPSGAWEWSEDYGFQHKYAFTYNPGANDTITDFGQNRISRVGAIADVNYTSTDADRNGTMLMGATYFTNASSTLSGIFFDDSNNTVKKKGYFVTTWFNADEIQDTWSRLWATFRRFLSETSSIEFKYRIYEEQPTYATITWVNTTSFTTTTDVSAYGPTASESTGGEVEVIQGTGSGSCVHISSIVEAGGTYTVTLDSAVEGVTTGTAKARFQKWVKLNPAAEPAQINSYLQAAMSASNVRIQVKGCMTFTGDDEFHKMALVSNEDIKITK